MLVNIWGLLLGFFICLHFGTWKSRIRNIQMPQFNVEYQSVTHKHTHTQKSDIYPSNSNNIFVKNRRGKKKKPENSRECLHFAFTEKECSARFWHYARISNKFVTKEVLVFYQTISNKTMSFPLFIWTFCLPTSYSLHTRSVFLIPWFCFYVYYLTKTTTTTNIYYNICVMARRTTKNTPFSYRIVCRHKNRTARVFFLVLVVRAISSSIILFVS